MYQESITKNVLYLSMKNVNMYYIRLCRVLKLHRFIFEKDKNKVTDERMNEQTK